MNGREYPVSTFIGRILKQDIGKRVYLVGGILQVENNEQRAERLKSMDQIITLTPDERQIMRAALAHYQDHCSNRAIEYAAAAKQQMLSGSAAKSTETASREYQQMKDDTMRLLCRIEE